MNSLQKPRIEIGFKQENYLRPKSLRPVGGGQGEYATNNRFTYRFQHFHDHCLVLSLKTHRLAFMESHRFKLAHCFI